MPLIKQRQIEGGVGGGVGGPFAKYTPIVIALGDTFIVPDNCQVLYSVPIQVDGDLIIDGDLVMVD